MKIAIFAFTSLLVFLSLNFQKTRMASLHDFTVKTIEGKELSLSTLKGKKVLVVNTASECGYTPQYEQLQKLYEKYKEKNFVIIGFPSNDFGQQEPGTNADIQSFCKKNYGVTFPMMAKITVVGDNAAPVYKWLTNRSENGVGDAQVKWNFQKFLIDENGKWVDVLSSKESPMCDKIVNWIEGK